MLTELSRKALLDQELKGRHRAERVLNTEVSYVWYLDRLEREEFDYINRVVKTLPLSVYEGMWTHSPVSLLCFSLIDLA